MPHPPEVEICDGAALPCPNIPVQPAGAHKQISYFCGKSAWDGSHQNQCRGPAGFF